MATKTTLINDADKHDTPLILHKITEDSVLQHVCMRRNDDRGLKNELKAWYLFPLHAVLSGLFTFAMLKAVNNHAFRTGAPPLWYDRMPLYQTDVMTLISSALVLIKLVSSAASAILVWRLIFILFEKDGLTLAVVCRMADYRIPYFSMGIWSCLSIVVIFLAWPSQFASPLATGSVAWQPTTAPNMTVTGSTMVSVAGAGSGWDGLNFWPEHRTQLVLRAAALAGFDATVSGFQDQYSVYMSRSIGAASDLLVNSTVVGITLPYFAIHDITWVDYHTVDPTFFNSLNETYGLLNTTGIDDPMLQTCVGNAALLKNTIWQRSNNMTGTAFPSAPATIESDVYVAIMVNRLQATDEDPNPPNCTTTTSPVLGSLPSVEQFSLPFYQGSKLFARNCYLLGKSKLHAGTYDCSDSDGCRVSSSNVANTVVTLTLNDSDSRLTSLSADPLRQTVLDFMPEVAGNICVMNITSLPMWNNLDNYITAMLTNAYQATWSTLMTRCESTTKSAAVHAPVDLITAQVSHTKMIVWLVCNFALLLSGIILWVAQYCADCKTIRNTTLAAMTIDLANLVDDQETKCGLCNAVELDNSDKKLGKLKWVHDSERPWHRSVALTKG